MKPRDRVLTTLQHQLPDRIPRFEIWIDALVEELGRSDTADAHVHFGQDCVMMPSRIPPGSNAWKEGVDEWGRVWKNGIYTAGVIDTDADLARYFPPLGFSEDMFDQAEINSVKRRYPDHCLIYGSHIGPFTAGYMAMGLERFFTRLIEDPPFITRLLDNRAEWCISIFQKAASLGAEVIILGDDAAHGNGPMVSPKTWRELVLPLHRQIVRALKVPVIWHSDGAAAGLLPFAVEAGFVGFHGLEPGAGNDLSVVKRDFGRSLVLIGNIAVNVLWGSDMAAVKGEVSRSIQQGSPGGGYMVATCNSISKGMNPVAVKEMFRWEETLV